ncbi:heptaprenyl diphosphate synthase component II [Bacillus sp. RG28]|uniref:Heptaprenyl diphosphate synthase component 2 n=1 Tax=Gottfriedia endophytica TaxID=2820819 RepID=A0A940NH73_9BACI|nr:heptaprenyl diphosphate synthase component II [Gottfriedia endophytica]MBP0724210.1 heptaprenyl diphosphate synthase component II [Gottfriedia endophytica]
MKVKWKYSYLKKDMDAIEHTLRQLVTTEQPILHAASLKLLEAGGKRFRPVFVILGAKFGKYQLQSIKNVAATLELIHMASLVHDDVIDEAKLRRGKETINEEHGNKIAMYAGDFLFARALESMSEIEESKAHQRLADTILEVCLGEIEQIKDKYNFKQNLRCYLRRIKRKTALLISASCEIGAIASGAELKFQTVLKKYGYYLGMSYQIMDDILDFTSSDKELGKPAGSDLLQGNITLPVLFAMENPTLHEKIIKVNENTSVEYMKSLIEDIKKSGSIDRARDISDRYLDKALSSIKDLPKGEAKSMLITIAKNIGKRKS